MIRKENVRPLGSLFVRRGDGLRNGCLRKYERTRRLPLASIYPDGDPDDNKTCHDIQSATTVNILQICSGNVDMILSRVVRWGPSTDVEPQLYV
jgi:hypothetical protein